MIFGNIILKYLKFNLWWYLKEKFILKFLFVNLCICRCVFEDNIENVGIWNLLKYRSYVSLLIFFVIGGIGLKDCVFLILYCLGIDCFKMCIFGNN